uniref:Uncharacterized protein n=1 Tax=Arundo donax TaxID=35708 RepID=A0A0A9DKV3_ARUDO
MSTNDLIERLPTTPFMSVSFAPIPSSSSSEAHHFWRQPFPCACHLHATLQRKFSSLALQEYFDVITTCLSWFIFQTFGSYTLAFAETACLVVGLDFKRNGILKQ